MLTFAFTMVQVMKNSWEFTGSLVQTVTSSYDTFWQNASFARFYLFGWVRWEETLWGIWKVSMEFPEKEQAHYHNLLLSSCCNGMESYGTVPKPDHNPVYTVYRNNLTCIQSRLCILVVHSLLYTGGWKLKEKLA